MILEMYWKQELEATMERNRNMQCSKMETGQLLPPRWLVERIMKYKSEEIGKGFRITEGICF